MLMSIGCKSMCCALGLRYKHFTAEQLGQCEFCSDHCLSVDPWIFFEAGMERNVG